MSLAQDKDHTMNDLAIRCTCGTLTGRATGLSRASCNRLVCHCDDCQSFAHFLGRADEILDANGGTEVVQVTPPMVAFSAGAPGLACVRLKPKGLFRWYAECCNTPVANTPPRDGIPFVSLIHSCLDAAAPPGGLEEVLGPVRARLHGRYATGDRTGLDIHDKAPVSLLFSVAGRLLRSRLRGEHLRSPFFDPVTHRAVRKPRTLSAEELQAVEEARDRYASA